MRVIRSFSESMTAPLVATIGFFDGVHRGHRFLLKEVVRSAHALGREAAVITFASHPRSVVRGNVVTPLIDSFEERLAKIAETGIDIAIVLDFTPQLAAFSAKQFLQLLRDRYGVQRLFVGYDHRFGHNRSEGFDDYVRYGAAFGLEVVLTPPYRGGELHVSSSVIRKLILGGQVREAACLLGAPFRFSGIVGAGRRLGRTIGFPTANLVPMERDKLIPRSGAYAVWVVCEDHRYEGMVNIGRRPTLEEAGHLSIEVHLFDFSGDLYGKELSLVFADFLREERRMGSLEELACQLKKDAEQAKGLLRGGMILK